MTVVKDPAFHRHDSKAGPSDGAEEGLGAAAARCAQPTVFSSDCVIITPCNALMAGLSTAGAAGADNFTDRRPTPSVNSMQTWRTSTAMLLWKELRCLSPVLPARR